MPEAESTGVAKDKTEPEKTPGNGRAELTLCNSPGPKPVLVVSVRRTGSQGPGAGEGSQSWGFCTLQRLLSTPLLGLDPPGQCLSPVTLGHKSSFHKEQPAVMSRRAREILPVSGTFFSSGLAIVSSHLGDSSHGSFHRVMD